MQMRYDSPDGLAAAGPDVSVALVTAAEGGAAQRALTPAERTRQAAFRHAGRRAHFALGRLALRSAAAARLGGSPDGVAIGVAADGAPEVNGLHVSISHGGAGDAAVGLAAAAGRPVGVDVEPIRARRPDLWRRILRDDERATLDALGGPSDRAHTLLWSVKEAVLKGQRTGLRAGARSVRIAPFADGDAGALDVWSERSGDWSVRFVRRGDLWLVLAVAAR